jgi:hypothetical protein
MNHPTAQTVSCLGAFDTWQEAEKHRKTLQHPDKYGLLCLWKDAHKELWAAAPLTVLDAFMEEKQ